MQRLVANHHYQSNTNSSKYFQQIINHRRLSPLNSVKLNYSNKFFIPMIGSIVQHLQPIATDFNNNDSTFIGTSQPCAVSDGIL